MNMYETILDIIEKNGPASIHLICQEMNQLPRYQNDRGKPVQPTQIESAISRKKELFRVNNNVVSIHPEKVFVSLTANVGCCPGPWYKINVNFVENGFTFFEWNTHLHSRYEPAKVLGCVNEFKKELYRLQIWKWQPEYQLQEIVLDGTSWSVELETKGKTYKSDGLQCFPGDWHKFCRSVSRLTGKKFL